jgi:hypothetical protein
MKRKMLIEPGKLYTNNSAEGVACRRPRGS